MQRESSVPLILKTTVWPSISKLFRTSSVVFHPHHLPPPPSLLPSSSLVPPSVPSSSFSQDGLLEILFPIHSKTLHPSLPFPLSPPPTLPPALPPPLQHFSKHLVRIPDPLHQVPRFLFLPPYRPSLPPSLLCLCHQGQRPKETPRSRSLRVHVPVRTGGKEGGAGKRVRGREGRREGRGHRDETSTRGH